MNRYEMLKNATIDEVADCLCYYFSTYVKESCDDCPATNKCYPKHRGMKDYLLEEVEE